VRTTPIVSPMTSLSYPNSSSDETSRWCQKKARDCQRVALTAKDPRVRLVFLHLAKIPWDGRPNLVSYGNQKNFQSFMQALKKQNADGFTPDEEWFRAFVAKAIIFRTIQSAVKANAFLEMRWPSRF
jgi:hypothetical protein